MTRYTVVWLSSAENELAELWLRSAERNAVASAANEIERVLGNQPAIAGENLAEGLRALNLPPLRVLYAVNENDRLVEIAIVREL